MQAFFVGLLFLVGVSVLAGLITILYPLLFAIGFLLRITLILGIFILITWGIGKFIILLWVYTGKKNTGKKKT